MKILQFIPGIAFRTATVIILTLVFLIAEQRNASAQIVADYNADATPTAQSPLDQGWLQWLSNGNVEKPPSAGQETINSVTYNCWDISNNVSGDPSGYAASYYVDFFNEPVNPFFHSPDGWTVSAKLRVDLAPNAPSEVMVQVWDGISNWQIFIVNNPNDGQYIGYRASSGNLVLHTTDVSSDYMNIQMFFDPEIESVTYYLNGSQIGGPIARSEVPVVGRPDNQWIRWGDQDAGGQLHRTGSYWNSVQMEFGYAIIPIDSL